MVVGTWSRCSGYDASQGKSVAGDQMVKASAPATATSHCSFSLTDSPNYSNNDDDDDSDDDDTGRLLVL